MSDAPDGAGSPQDEKQPTASDAAVDGATSETKAAESTAATPEASAAPDAVAASASSPAPATTSPPSDSATAGQGDASAGGTPWARTQALHAKGLNRAAIIAELTSSGVEAESARVLVNSLPNAPQPTTLPGVAMEVGQNPLAPNMFSIADLGLSGPPGVVGLYWLAFGGVLLAVFGMLLLTSDINPWGEPSPLTRAMAKVGLVVGALAAVRGVWRIVTKR